VSGAADETASSENSARRLSQADSSCDGELDVAKSRMTADDVEQRTP